MDKMDPVFLEIFPSRPAKGDVKRHSIILAAIHCLARSGFEGGTFDKIAARIKTRRSHVAYYYDDRDQLLGAVIQYIIANAQRITVQKVTAQKTPLDQILAMWEAAYEWAELFPDQARVLLLFYSACTNDPKHRRLNTHIREAGYSRIRALLGVIFHGQSTNQLDLDELARGLQELMTGAMVDQFATDLPDKLNFREFVFKLIKQWVVSANITARTE